LDTKSIVVSKHRTEMPAAAIYIQNQQELNSQARHESACHSVPPLWLPRGELLCYSTVYITKQPWCKRCRIWWL